MNTSTLNTWQKEGQALLNANHIQSNLWEAHKIREEIMILLIKITDMEEVFPTIMDVNDEKDLQEMGRINRICEERIKRMQDLILELPNIDIDSMDHLIGSLSGTDHVYLRNFNKWRMHIEAGIPPEVRSEILEKINNFLHLVIAIRDRFIELDI